MPLKVPREGGFLAGPKRGAFDFLLLVGSALLLIALGAGSFALRDEYHFGEFWLWGGWIGVGTFASVAGFLRSKFRQRGFTVFCVVWFPVHMAVALGAAARYPILIFLLPVTVELWVGFTIAFWLFALPPKGGE